MRVPACVHTRARLLERVRASNSVADGSSGEQHASCGAVGCAPILHNIYTENASPRALPDTLESTRTFASAAVLAVRCNISILILALINTWNLTIFMVHTRGRRRRRRLYRLVVVHQHSFSSVAHYMAKAYLVFVGGRALLRAASARHGNRDFLMKRRLFASSRTAPHMHHTCMQT